ncbi:MAG: KpsF/GutQ family sugar-phosphate isomerase [Aureliella sp.]
MTAVPISPSGHETDRAARQAILVARGKSILQSELDVLSSVRHSVAGSFACAVEMLLACRGKVVTCGIGKAGIVAQKLAASLSSTGTPSQFLHPAEAVHGDLGCLQPADLVLLLSYSGETEEVTRLLPQINSITSNSIAITARAESTLAKSVDCTLLLGSHDEACALNLAPSSSTTAMMALGDALTLVASEQRGFSREQFAQFHPGGSLGKKLTRVEEVMRPLEDCRIAPDHQTVREVLIHVSRPGRRTGAIMLIDQSGELSGVFTDSDLARRLESGDSSLLEQPITSVMSKSVRVVQRGCLLTDVMQQLTAAKISELPVVDQANCPLGIVDVTDVVSLLGTSPSTASQDGLDRSCGAESDIAAADAGVPKIIPIHQSR